MTQELREAIDHVKQYHPVSLVVFDAIGQWCYMGDNFEHFEFDERINVGILERASDSLLVLPYVIDLRNINN